MICNACGKKILYKGEIPQEDVCTFIKECEQRQDPYNYRIKEWGYFSKKDLQVHKFNLCEECYDRITSSFAVPVEISEKTEVMSMPFSVTIHGTATPYSHSSP